MTEHGECDHNHADDAPTRFAKHGNLAIGTIGLVAGAATGSAPVLADAGHNFGDFFAHREHLETSEAERHKKGEESAAKRRKRAGLIIGSIAAATALYSGIELQSQLNSDEREPIKTVAAFAELGSIGVNLAVRRKFKQQPAQLAGRRHSEAHNNVDLGCSVAAFGGIVINPFIPGAEAVARLGVSVVTARLANRVYAGKIH